MTRPRPDILFIRTGTDPNGHDFRHTLVFSKAKEKDRLHLISEGRDLEGKAFREEWAHAVEPKDMAALVANTYLSLRKADFEGVILPALSRLSPRLADLIAAEIEEDELFPGDW